MNGYSNGTGPHNDGIMSTMSGQAIPHVATSPVTCLPGNVSALDSRVFRTMFGCDQMRQHMSDSAYTEALVQAEVALAKVEGELGIIPQSAADDIARCCSADKLDLQKLRHDGDIVGYPIWGLTRQLTAMVDSKESAKYIHWGPNTHDIMDLAVAIQMKNGLNLIERQINTVRGILAALAKKHRDTIMIARTHLQHALPTTFGYKCAVWLYGLDRHLDRLEQLRPRVLMSQVGGASGSIASLGMGSETQAPDGMRVLGALARELGITEPPIAWHVVRDGIAEVVSFLALVGGTIGKIAYDIMLMSMHEVAEVAEPFVPHRGASSTMPHKRNPISSEIMLALAKILRSHVSIAMDALPSDFERATGPWHLEFVAIPEAFTYCSASLHHAEFTLKGLQVNVEKMEQNLSVSNGLSLAEHVMVGIAPHVGRAKAHDIIYESCKECIESGVNLNILLKKNPEVTRYLSVKEIDWYCDPRNYLGSTLAMVDRLLASKPRDSGSLPFDESSADVASA